jgi:signal transduction histidine kinase
MQVSQRFIALMDHQLAQFADRSDLRSLVVYLALPRANGKPGLIPVGHWPRNTMALPAVDEDRSLQLPSAERRWLPLRHERLLLGALRVETASLPWPENLTPRLQAAAHCLTEALCLDLEQQRLAAQLERQQQQLRLLVHQLRNPLAALRTFGQLLRRKLENDPDTRALVDSLLAEEKQLNRYVEAIDSLAVRPLIGPATEDPQPLLLPPSLSSAGALPLEERLEPLLQRAAATASLQGRPWQAPPPPLPRWRGDSASVAEILANLLENAFRYSAEGTPVGVHWSDPGDAEGPRLTVWDGGAAIDPSEREGIFQRGVRGEQAKGKAGTGLGLALARELARNLGGELELVIPPRAVDPALPEQGNAFCLHLPASA